MKQYRLYLITSLVAVVMGGALAVAQLSSKAQVKTPVKAVEQAKVQEPNTLAFEPATVQSLLEAVNAERAKVGAEPLILDERLNESAQAKADDMSTNKYFDHVDANGKAGIAYISKNIPCARVGENIRASNDLVAPMHTNAVMIGWIQSEPHYRAMIDSRNVYTGFGISNGLYVQHFCEP